MINIDEEYEYRHVYLPKEIGNLLPHPPCKFVNEWDLDYVRQSHGWKHYKFINLKNIYYYFNH